MNMHSIAMHRQLRPDSHHHSLTTCQLSSHDSPSMCFLADLPLLGENLTKTRHIHPCPSDPPAELKIWNLRCRSGVKGNLPPPDRVKSVARTQSTFAPAAERPAAQRMRASADVMHTAMHGLEGGLRQRYSMASGTVRITSSPHSSD